MKRTTNSRPSGGLAGEIDPFLKRLRRRAAALSRAEPLVLKAELEAIGGLIGASTAALAMFGTLVGEQAIPDAREPAGSASATMTVRSGPSQPLAGAHLRAVSESDEMAREVGQTPEAVRLTFAELQRGNSRCVQDLASSRVVAFLRALLNTSTVCLSLASPWSASRTTRWSPHLEGEGSPQQNVTVCDHADHLIVFNNRQSANILLFQPQRSLRDGIFTRRLGNQCRLGQSYAMKKTHSSTPWS